MPAIKRVIARKAVKSTAKHTAHGTTSKLKRDPLSTATLLVVGIAVGLIAGWTIARAGSPAPQPD